MKKVFLVFNLALIAQLSASDDTKSVSPDTETPLRAIERSLHETDILESCKWKDCTDKTNWFTLFQLRKHIHECHYKSADIIPGLTCQWDNCTQSTSFGIHELFRHLESTNHLNIKRFHCPAPLCTAAYGQKGHLTHHIRETHNKDNAPRFACPSPGCTSNFSRKSSVNKHIVKEHIELLFPTLDTLPTNSTPIPDLEPEKMDTETVVEKPSKKPRIDLDLED